MRASWCSQRVLPAGMKLLLTTSILVALVYMRFGNGLMSTLAVQVPRSLKRDIQAMQRPLFTAESHGIVTKGAWKDEWITGWIERQFKENKAGVGLLLNGSLDMSCIVTTINDEANCVVPKYIPARMQMAPATTRIPKVIWQTWKSRHVGASAYKALNTWITYNPEYEYIFFEDQDVEEFMCTFAPTYSTIVAYDLLRFGACRADIWRVLVTERYGGIYIDSDSGAKEPFRDFIPFDADVVSGMGGLGDMHQWFLAYSPRHPFLRRALKSVVSKLLALHEERKWANCAIITGPTAYWEGVQNVLRENNCTVDESEANAHQLTYMVPLGTCPNEATPNKIGKIKLYDSDYCGDHVTFKYSDVESERNRQGHVRYTTEGFELMFRPDVGHLCEKTDSFDLHREWPPNVEM